MNFKKSFGAPNQSMSMRGPKTLNNFGNKGFVGGSMMKKGGRANKTVMSAVSKNSEDSDFTVTGIQDMKDSQISNYQD